MLLFSFLFHVVYVKFLSLCGVSKIVSLVSVDTFTWSYEIQWRLRLWTVFKCLFKLHLWLKCTEQISQRNGFCPLCFRMCDSKWALCKNEFFLQMSHSYRITLALHTLTWASCSVFCENPSKQPGQRKANSSAWTFAWFLRWVNCENSLLQRSHRYGFSPVCVRSCVSTCVV